MESDWQGTGEGLRKGYITNWGGVRVTDITEMGGRTGAEPLSNKGGTEQSNFNRTQYNTSVAF